MVVVSNRLPVVLKRRPDGSFRASPGNGGLVTALTPVLQKRGGTWVGWPGAARGSKQAIEDALGAAGQSLGMALLPLSLTADEVAGFYRGFSNEILWPLFHDLVTTCNFDSAYWDVYRHVNEKVARLVANEIAAEDFVWVQDYHFLTVGGPLRRMGVKNRLGFFLHTPFPAPDMFLRLPWRRQILQALQEFDLIGFQCPRDHRNFLECVETLRSARVEEGPTGVTGLHGADRPTRVGSFPIGIDFSHFRSLAESPSVVDRATRLRADLGGRRILLGVDRLDYTKGLPQKIRAFRRALELYPELRESVTLVQHVVPSRESVPQYRELRLSIERLVGEVNGSFGTPSWTPVRYFYHRLDREELSSFYVLADALLVTSLKDGMNLVSKEYCASKPHGSGALVLSEFAGASVELGKGALLVNPYDSEGLARTIHHAVTMSAVERGARMSALHEIVRERDVFEWVGSFLRAAGLEDTGSTPPSEESSWASEPAASRLRPLRFDARVTTSVPSV